MIGAGSMEAEGSPETIGTTAGSHSSDTLARNGPPGGRPNIEEWHRLSL